MYTTTTATRDFALKATAAAERAMERHACCKSQFKFKCFSCGGMIHRGDKITRCIKATTGMKLRYRGADADRGLTMDETIFYQAETGKNMWVHVGCIPCYWDSLPEDSNEYSRPSLRPICTGWGVKVYGEFEEWCDSQHIDHDHFCLMKGYPKEKFMRDRIIHNVTRFQALWRGYIYKKAYPVALLQAQAEQMYPPAMLATVDTEIEAALSYRSQTCWEEEWRQNNALERWLWSGEGGYNVGDHIEVLFNENQQTEALYSGEVIEVQYRGSMPAKIKVKFHYDGEVRNYTGEKFNLLKREGEEHKRKRGIEANFTGRIFTKLCSTKKKKKKKKKKEKQDDEGDLFLLDY